MPYFKRKYLWADLTGGIAVVLVLYILFTLALVSSQKFYAQPVANPAGTYGSYGSYGRYSRPVQVAPPGSPRLNQAQYHGNSPTGYPPPAAGSDNGSEKVLIILDASETMSDKINEHESKMVAAKRNIFNVLSSTPPTTQVGLRVYGYSNPGNPCLASRLVVPISLNTRYAISNQLLDIQPYGKTPISYSLQEALAHDFTGLSGKKSIILVTDGMETCDADPCAVMVAMMRNGANVKVNVVGYGIDDEDAMKQLRCVALATKGKFYSANTSAALADSLGTLLGAKKSVQAQVFIPNNQAGASPSGGRPGQNGTPYPAYQP